MTEHYPFSVTFHGKDIVEVRGHMVAFLADNVTPGVQVEVQPSDSTKKPRKTTKKAKTKNAQDKTSQTEDSPTVSADIDTTQDSNDAGSPVDKTQGSNSNKAPDVTPEEHPNVSLAYNNALERLMELYNGSPEGSYEVTLLLEEYRVASFREIPEDRGVELLDKANLIAVKLTTETAKVDA